MLNYIYITFLFCKQNYIIKYKRSYLGFLWALFNPALLLISTSIVFSSLFKIKYDEYFSYIFSGLIPWFLINQTIISSSSILITNENLIKKHKFKLILLPISTVIVSLVDSLIFLSLYFIYQYYFNGVWHYDFFLLLIIYAILSVFCFGMSLFISLLNVFIRDLQWILQVGLQAVFYMTPILYKPGEIGGFFGTLFSFNPVSIFVMLFHKCLNNQKVDPELLLSSISISFLFALLGLIYFNKLSRKIVYSL